MITMILSIVTLWVFRFPLAYVLSVHTNLGEQGIWWAFPIANVLVAMITVIWFCTGTWKSTKITEEVSG